MRKLSFANSEIYHVYNRGVDKRNLFKDQTDIQRFMQGMVEFNVLEPIGSIYEQSLKKKRKAVSDKPESPKLVDFVCYCINPNHYHFLLMQCEDDGISKFMKRLGGGYSWYFNNRYKRNGALFQGPFKAIHVNSNEYLLHLSAYVNLNDRVHHLQFGDRVAKLGRSSWGEYTAAPSVGGNVAGLCSTDVILGQFKNRKAYATFARAALKDILRGKKDRKLLDSTLLLE